MILVTGGSGFIGRALVEELLNRGYRDVTIVDHHPSPFPQLPFIPAKELFSSRRALKNLRLMFHLGACSDTREKDLSYLRENNTQYSWRLFQWAIEESLPFIYASSAATYGLLPPGGVFSDEHDFIPSLSPLNPYGQSKHLFDLEVLNHPRHPPHWFGLKFFNVFGPGESHKGEMASMAYRGYHQILQSKRMRLFLPPPGKKAPLRDFIFIDDVIRVMAELGALCLSPPSAPPSGIYNIGTGRARSFEELAEALFRAMNLKLEIDHVPMPESLVEQYQFYTQASLEKLTKALPHVRFLELEEGVRECVLRLQRNES